MTSGDRAGTGGQMRLDRGFGAGAGAALIMMGVMALVRLALGLPSIPELLQGAFLRLVPGDVFEFMIHLLKSGAKVLLLVLVLEGMLLTGGGLGWLYTRLRRPTRPGAGQDGRPGAAAYAGGGAYGLLIGLALLASFWLLYALQIMNPQPSDSVLFPVSASLVLYGLVFGVALASLLPPATTAPAGRRAAEPAPAALDRRGFLRVGGGTALALLGGAGLWGVFANMLAEPAQAALVAANGPGAAAIATTDPTQLADLATAIAESGGDPSSLADGTMTPAPPATTTETATPAAARETPAAETNTPVPAADTAVPARPTAAPVKDVPPVDTPAPSAPAPATAAPATNPATTVPRGNTPTAVPPANTATSVPPADTPLPPTAVAQVPPLPTSFPAVPVLSPEITPTANFYITTKNFTDPVLDGGRWSLSIRGLVDHPMTLTLANLKQLPAAKVIHTLECISNTVGGDLIGNGRWAGIRVPDLLALARPKTGVADVILRAADDYSDSVPLSVLMNPDTVLAFEMNGQPLTARHGYPARLLIPGIFGMKNVKWITSLDLVNYDYKGFWQAQGWSDPAPYLTMSRIDYPGSDGLVTRGPLYVTGIAFAGNRGIQRVEVSTDGGKTWGDAQVRRPLGRNAWALWTYPWIPATPGVTTLAVRATDGTGSVQTARDTNNYPNGASGYHRIAVKIV